MGAFRVILLGILVLSGLSVFSETENIDAKKAKKNLFAWSGSLYLLSFVVDAFIV